MSIVHDNPEIEAELESDPSLVPLVPRLRSRMQTEVEGLRRVTISAKDRGRERQIGSFTITDTGGVPDAVDPDDVAHEITRYALYHSDKESKTARCVARLYNKRLDSGRSKFPPSIQFSVEHPSVRQAYADATEPEEPRQSKMSNDEDDDEDTESVDGAAAALVLAVKTIGENLQKTAESYQSAHDKLLSHYRFLLHEATDRASEASEREHEIMLRLAGGEREEMANRALDRAIEGLIANADLYRDLQTQISSQRILEQREQRKADGSARLAQDLLDQLKTAMPLAGIALMSKMTGKPPEECAAVVAAMMGGGATMAPPTAAAGPPPPSPPRPSPAPAYPTTSPAPQGSSLVRRSNELHRLLRPEQWDELRGRCTALQIAQLEGWLTASDEKSCLEHLVGVQRDRTLLREFTQVVDEEQGQLLMDLVDDLKSRVGFVETTAADPAPRAEPKPRPKRKQAKKKASKRKSSRS